MEVRRGSAPAASTRSIIVSTFHLRGRDRVLKDHADTPERPGQVATRALHKVRELARRYTGATRIGWAGMSLPAQHLDEECTGGRTVTGVERGDGTRDDTHQLPA